MDAKQVQVNDFMKRSDTTFEIPIYQRNYAWKKQQCERLLSDILSAEKSGKPHFIGTVVYIRNRDNRTSGVDEYMIIDGQQRLTTLTLLYFTLYHRAEEWGESDEALGIFERYLINKHSKDVDKTKLKPVGDNLDALNCIRMKAPTDFDGKKGFSQAIENYQYFKSQITDKETFNSILSGLNKLEMVWIELDSDRDNPQRIFESLNSTGVPLEQGDLIRNYILMRPTSKEQKELYELWEIIDRNARIDVPKKEGQRTSRVSEFIRDYLTIKTKTIQKEDNVYPIFKERYLDMTFYDVKNLLEELKELAKCYGKLLNPSWETKPEIRLHIGYINLLEVSVAYPFLMQVYRDYETHVIDAATFVSVLELVQSYVWRRAIFSSRINLNKIFKDLYDKNIINKSDGTSYLESIARTLLERKNLAEFPKDADVVQLLNEKPIYDRISQPRVKYLLDLNQAKAKR